MPDPLERFQRLSSQTLTVRHAGRLIALCYAAIAIVGGLAIWILDHREFPTLGKGLWWSVQTITTVGYGDIVPTGTVGQLIGAVIMVFGIGFITVITATVTAAFVENARMRIRGPRDQDVAERLERIERHLEELRREN